MLVHDTHNVGFNYSVSSTTPMQSIWDPKWFGRLELLRILTSKMWIRIGFGFSN